MDYVRPVFLKLVITASLLLWGSLTVTPAMAGDVTFIFEGMVTSVDASIGTQYSIDTTGPNSILTGSYTFNSESVGLPNVPFAYTQLFFSPISNLTFNLGTFTFNGPPPVDPNLAFDSTIYVARNLFIGGEEYLVDSTFLNGVDPGTFQLALFGGLGASIDDSMSLPTRPPDLSSFLSKGFRLVFDPQGNPGVVDGSISSLTLAAVPLPPAIILFGAGLVALAGLGAGRWRQKRPSLT
jgi:hypothetical protein